MDMEDLDLVYIEEYRAALVIVDNMLVRRKWKYLATVKIDNHVIFMDTTSITDEPPVSVF